MSAILCDKDGFQHLLLLFSGWFDSPVSRYIHFFTGQAHLLETCYNSHENSNYCQILKNEKHLYMSHSEYVLQ